MIIDNNMSQLDRDLFEQGLRIHNEGYRAGYRSALCAFEEQLNTWDNFAITGMKEGKAAYFQGYLSLITNLREWIEEQRMQQINYENRTEKHPL